VKGLSCRKRSTAVGTHESGTHECTTRASGRSVTAAKMTRMIAMTFAATKKERVEVGVGGGRGGRKTAATATAAEFSAMSRSCESRRRGGAGSTTAFVH
jgi:hypothetical protein